MAFSPQFLDDIRTRVSLAGIVGRHVRLQRKGREHLGLCPFHKEKTPSFTVNEEKGFYHCFGCGAHGSVFDFIMETKGLSFSDAVNWLAREAGLVDSDRIRGKDGQSISTSTDTQLRIEKIELIQNLLIGYDGIVSCFNLARTT
ncbi:MAG TPA: CHC2 zinc finger domain-containing protein [Rhodospirillales bacterium]